MLAVEQTRLEVVDDTGSGRRRDQINPPVMMRDRGLEGGRSSQTEKGYGLGIQNHGIARQNVLYQCIAKAGTLLVDHRGFAALQGRIGQIGPARIDSRQFLNAGGTDTGTDTDPGQFGHGTFQFVWQPDIVLISQSNRSRGQIGMRQQRDKIDGAALPATCQQANVAFWMGLPKGCQDFHGFISRSVVANPQRPVVMGLVKKGLQLLCQMLCAIVSTHQNLDTARPGPT